MGLRRLSGIENWDSLNGTTLSGLELMFYLLPQGSHFVATLGCIAKRRWRFRQEKGSGLFVVFTVLYWRVVAPF